MNLRTSGVVVAFAAFALAAHASWYWPFGDDDGDEPDQPRLSELMEPATTNIDAAADFAAEGKISESVECYRAALTELDRIERENPERAASAEFATLRNKRAYVNAAIDSMLLAQARENAKAVAVTDTRELEKRLEELRSSRRRKAAENDGDAQTGSGERDPLDKTGGINRPKLERQIDAYVEGERERSKRVLKAADAARMDREMQQRINAALEEDPNSRKARVMQAGERLRKGETAAAKEILRKLLNENPNDVPALNMLAACETADGDLAAAKTALDAAIDSNPNDYHAYYNLAMLFLEKGDTDVARRYYETGKTYGGPVNEQLEQAVGGGNDAKKDGSDR